MKVLSLFDGMSCGQLALQRLGIRVDKYYASEIDKYAIQVTQANFPNTIQIGDVKTVKPEDYADIDLIICGSPCQGFSFAGKQLAFDDPRSALFFEFIRILKQVKPKYFLLENVRMKKEFIEIISQQVSRCYPELPGTDLFDSKIEPILINSALLSAQSRQRLYWTNIPNVKQPEDLGIVLKDILEDDYESERNKSYCIDANYFKGASVEQYQKKSRRQLVNKPIKVGMNIEEVKVRKHKIDIEHLQRFLEVYKKRSKKTQKQIATELDVPLTQVSHWFRTDNCFSIPPADLWLALRKVINADNDSYDKKIMEFEYRDGVYETKQRVYSDQGKAPTLTASNKEQMIETKPKQVGNNKKQYISKQSVEKYVEDVNADFNDPYNKKTIKGNKSTALRTNSSNGNMWVNEKALKETKPKQVGIASDIKGHDILKRVYSPEGKSPTLNSMGGGNREPKVVSGGAFRGRAYDQDGKRKDRDGKSVANQTKQMLELRKDDKSNAITTVGKDSVVVSTKPNQINPSKKASGKQPYMQERVFHKEGKSHALTREFASRTHIGETNELTWRKLTPNECMALQTVRSDYLMPVSNTQKYKLLGNGWTVDVIAHIFTFMQRAHNGEHLVTKGQQSLDF